MPTANLESPDTDYPQRLVVHGCRLNDEALQTAVPYLVPSLRILDLSWNSVSADTIEALTVRLPHLEEVRPL